MQCVIEGGRVQRRISVGLADHDASVEQAVEKV